MAFVFDTGIIAICCFFTLHPRRTELVKKELTVLWRHMEVFDGEKRFYVALLCFASLARSFDEYPDASYGMYFACCYDFPARLLDFTTGEPLCFAAPACICFTPVTVAFLGRRI